MVKHPLVSIMRELRQEAGISQFDLGQRCDPPIGQSTINRIESGRMIPTIVLFDRLLAELGHELDVMRLG